MINRNKTSQHSEQIGGTPICQENPNKYKQSRIKPIDMRPWPGHRVSFTPLALPSHTSLSFSAPSLHTTLNSRSALSARTNSHEKAEIESAGRRRLRVDEGNRPAGQLIDEQRNTNSSSDIETFGDRNKLLSKSGGLVNREKASELENENTNIGKIIRNLSIQ